ncbi:MAG: hypothetical protein WCG01_02410 [bacterium]
MEAILGISQTSINNSSTIINNSWHQGILIPTGMKNICKMDLYADGSPYDAYMAIAIKDSLTGPALYYQTVHFTQMGWNEFWFDTVFTVTPGKMYYINLQRPGGSYMSWGKNVFGNPYPDGMSYIDTTPHPSHDFAFKVYYTEPVIKQSISLLGTGAISLKQVSIRFKVLSQVATGVVALVPIMFWQLVLSCSVFSIVKLSTFAKLFSSARKKIYEMTDKTRQFILKSKA